MSKKNLMIFSVFLLFSIILISSVSAQVTQQFSTDPQLSHYVSNGYTISPVVASDSQINKDFKIHFRVYDSNGKLVPVSSTEVNCSAFLFSPNGDRVYSFNGNEAMTYSTIDDGDRVYSFNENEEMTNLTIDDRLATVPASFINKTGTYHWYVVCEGDTNGGSMQGIVDVTQNGEGYLDKPVTPQIILITFFTALLFLVAYLKNKIDFERWYKNMLKKHEKRNFVKLTFSIIGYNIMKNVYILYYLIGFVLMTLIYNIAFLYNLEVILPIFKILMFIYSWSVILIGLVLIGNIQEWAMNWMKDLEDNNWGMSK